MTGIIELHRHDSNKLYFFPTTHKRLNKIDVVGVGV
jgi:hypothetical protein